MLAFCQIHECEGLQETVASLKQQLLDALELKHFNQALGHSQCFTEMTRDCVEKENTVLKDPNEGLLLQAQVPYFMAHWVFL